MCKIFAKNGGAFDIQVNSANYDEAYIQQTGKNYVTRILCGVCATKSCNSVVDNQQEPVKQFYTF